MDWPPLPLSEPGPRPSLKDLLERDGSHCSICRDSIECLEDANVDHIVPKFRVPDGICPDYPWNMRATHRSCNGRKAALLPNPKDIRWDLIPEPQKEVARRMVQHAYKIGHTVTPFVFPASAWPKSLHDFVHQSLPMGTPLMRPRPLA